MIDSVEKDDLGSGGGSGRSSPSNVTLDLLKDTSEMSFALPIVSALKDENLSCKIDIDERDKNTTYTVCTDENGGFYHLPNIKSQLYIPDGALAEETRIQIIEYSEQTLGKNTDIDLKSKAISNIYEFLSHGQSFIKYVTFRFPLELMHRFDVGGLKVLYSATGKGEEADWQEIPLTSSRGAHSSGLSWLVWERHCYVMMQHFCKIQVITTDTGEETSALYVNASLIGQYLEQLQLVEMHVVFSCGENDDTEQRQKIDSEKKVLSQEVLLLYENGGDIQMKLTLHDKHNWQVDEDEQTQLLDNNILFLEPLCELKTLPKLSFTIHQKQSTLLKGKVSLKQNHRENGKMFICNLDVKEMLKNYDEEIQTIIELKLEKENLLRNCQKLQEEKEMEQEQKEKFKEELEKLQKKDGDKNILNMLKDRAKSSKKSLLPVAKGRGSREYNPCRKAMQDVAVTSQSGNGVAAHWDSMMHAPETLRQCFPSNAENKGGNNFIVNNITNINYNDPGKQDKDCLAIEDKTWPTGFDKEFRKYLFEFLVKLDKDKAKLHTIAEELGIIHTNGFNAKELVTAWYVKNMGENNNINNGNAQTIWEDLRTILVTQNHAQAAEYLTLAIEKQRVRDNMEHFVHNLRMDYIIDKLFSRRLIDRMQKKDFQQEKLSVGYLITEVVLVADLQKFQVFKESLKETDQNVLLDIIKVSEEQ